MGLMKLLGLDFSEFKEKLEDTRILYTSLAEGLTFLHNEHKKLDDKVELLAVHLEDEIKTLENETKTQVIHERPLQLRNLIDTRISTTNAIIQALKMSGISLHYKGIFDIIKNYNLKRPGVTLETVRSISYQLARQKKIKNGKKAGTFYFKEQKDS